MRSRAIRVVAIIVVVIVVVVAVGLAVVYSGVYNVSARYPDRAAVDWLLGTAMDHSVQRHAAGLQAPPLDDPAQLRLGFQHYRGMCLECHGRPGVEASELAQGLSPSPPALVESAGDWQPSELFWITQNGVRMTGMPAWGGTHTDEQIWAIVAFVRQLPKMTKEEYQALDRATPALPED